jgi:hypothetical protein
MPLRALVIGGSGSALEEADAALKLFEPDAVLVVNDLIARWPGKIDYACTLHSEKLAGWIRERRGNQRFQVWCHRPFRGVHRTTKDWAGSSGLFAVKIAIEEGFEKVVVAGVPMLGSAKHIARNREWGSARTYQRGWTTHVAEIKDKVRSMSGWTKDLVGFPTPEWLGE